MTDKQGIAEEISAKRNEMLPARSTAKAEMLITASFNVFSVQFVANYVDSFDKKHYNRKKTIDKNI